MGLYYSFGYIYGCFHHPEDSVDQGLRPSLLLSLPTDGFIDQMYQLLKDILAVWLCGLLVSQAQKNDGVQFVVLKTSCGGRRTVFHITVIQNKLDAQEYNHNTSSTGYSARLLFALFIKNGDISQTSYFLLIIKVFHSFYIIKHFY